MHKILQITDIHINGDYSCKFDVKGHFERIVSENKGIEYDAIALTGDLADNGSCEDYDYILDTLINTFGKDTPILVTPGNHDDRGCLECSYADYVEKYGSVFKNGITIQRAGGSFEDEGTSVTIITIPRNTPFSIKLVALDNAHNAVPHKGIQVLHDMEFGNRLLTEYFLFMHKPMLMPFHRFMNSPKYSIPEDECKTALMCLEAMQIHDIFCGHYHCHSIDAWCGWTQYTAPASQCQLDPFSEECVPSGNYPGYAVIDPFVSIKSKFKFITGVPDEK